jgi:hypothetical protein
MPVGVHKERVVSESVYVQFVEINIEPDDGRSSHLFAGRSAIRVFGFLFRNLYKEGLSCFE